jgi:outer membrane protein OmpA-like peptidoglycan-associated protein
MTKKLTAIAIACAILAAGCSSIPKPPMPDGSDRQPVNSTAKIEAFQARTAEETANFNERSALSRQVDSLKEQVSELKAYLVMMQAAQASTAPLTKPPAAQPSKIEAVKSGRIEPIGTTGGETMEVRAQSVVFRITHPFGKTAFNVSPDTAAKLLLAAKDAKHIDIRGRTDAAHDDAVDRDIAMMRALHARRYLIEHGVDPKKIRWSSLASGGYVADNSTPEGQAKNRRVEIETMDLDTTAFNNVGRADVKVGSAQ